MIISEQSRSNFNFQKLVAAVSIILFFVKVTAWYLTGSVAILSDALESIVNVVSGMLGLYSLYLSSLPKDKNHPNGHGKIEFISAGLEGGMIAVASLFIAYEAVHAWLHPSPMMQLDWGIGLSIVSALVNYLFGTYAVKKGRLSKSLALEASGKHLQTDTWSTLAVVIGLGVVMLTKWYWVDKLVAIVFTIFSIRAAWGILREAMAGIMDESDEELLSEVVDVLNEHRQDTWIDVHNLRVIKYGSVFHFDMHLTLPWYYDVRQAHDELHRIEEVFRKKFGASVEMFVHTDACILSSCSICGLQSCSFRGTPMVSTLGWNVDNVVENARHS